MDPSRTVPSATPTAGETHGTGSSSKRDLVSTAARPTSLERTDPVKLTEAPSVGRRCRTCQDTCHKREEDEVAPASLGVLARAAIGGCELSRERLFRALP